MTDFVFKAGQFSFEPAWIEFNKAVFIAGYGYVTSVGLSTQKEDRPDRPSCAGASKIPEGWLIWMESGAAAVIPEPNVKYIGAVRTEDAHRYDDLLKGQHQLENKNPVDHLTPQQQFAHLPQPLRDKILAQALGGFAGDTSSRTPLTQTGGPAASPPVHLMGPTPVPQPPSPLEAPKKRRGRPPKVRPEAVAEPSA